MVQFCNCPRFPINPVALLYVATPITRKFCPLEHFPINREFSTSIFSSQARRCEDVHAVAQGTDQHSEQSDKVVRLPVAHAEVVRRGEGHQLSSR